MHGCSKNINYMYKADKEALEALVKVNVGNINNSIDHDALPFEL